MNSVAPHSNSASHAVVRHAEGCESRCHHAVDYVVSLRLSVGHRTPCCRTHSWLGESFFIVESNTSVFAERFEQMRPDGAFECRPSLLGSPTYELPLRRAFQRKRPPHCLCRRARQCPVDDVRVRRVQKRKRLFLTVFTELTWYSKSSVAWRPSATSGLSSTSKREPACHSSLHFVPACRFHFSK